MDKKKLIMVMGVQRSGTTALFNSLARDQSLSAMNESVDNEIFYKYHLRPVEQIAPILDATPGTVLLKPLSETYNRSIEMVRAEFAAYEIRFIWIYRDPVNVIFSMHKKGWLRQSEIDRAVHVDEWIRRNQAALTFRERNPAEIAFVRYEDLLADPAVFRALCRWLEVSGEPLFRPDRGQGRHQISAQAQQKIDASAAPILGALATARTFRPRALRRWKDKLAASLNRTSRKWRATRPPQSFSSEIRWNCDGAQVVAAVPSSIGSLLCWIDAGKKPSGGDRLGGFVESGPRRLPAAIDSQPPFHIPYLNGKHAFYFPFEKAAFRQKGPPGLISFGDAGDWRFLFQGTPFSVFALFKPTLPRRAICKQERAIVLSVGNGLDASGLTVVWNRTLETTEIILREAETDTPVVASAPAGSHPNHQWRVFHFQFGGVNDSQISISSNGIAGAPVFFAVPQIALPGARLGLRLGGTGEPTALFYGAFAELIVFQRALTADEQAGLLSYLREKYGL